MNRYLILLSLVLLSVTGCDVTRDRLANVGKAPAFTDVQSPNERPSYKPIKWPDEEEPQGVRQANSLWQPGSRTFFRDPRARRIGDILRVMVSIDEKAEVDNATNRVRASNDRLGVPNMFGLESLAASKLLPDAADPASLLSATGNSSHNGTGSMRRKEKIETEVAAMVTQILPNGNLVISGSQEIRVNFEIREISVDGIVRPQDISADNTLNHSQIAEARITYGGRGQLTDVQQPRIGSQIVDVLSPF